MVTSVIDTFATGSYEVTRTSEGTYVDGLYAPGIPSSFDILASVQPLSGRDLKVLPEAQHGEEMRVVFTAAELRTRTGGNEPDTMAIDGAIWTVKRVERWDAFGATHYRVYVARSAP